MSTETIKTPHDFIFNMHSSITRLETKKGKYDPRSDVMRTKRITTKDFICVNCGKIFQQEDDNYYRPHLEMLPVFPSPVFPVEECIPPAEVAEPIQLPKKGFWKKLFNKE